MSAIMTARLCAVTPSAVLLEGWNPGETPAGDSLSDNHPGTGPAEIRHLPYANTVV
jgi:hypothetical protein